MQGQQKRKRRNYSAEFLALSPVFVFGEFGQQGLRTGGNSEPVEENEGTWASIEFYFFFSL
jgi:hypothetical protein